MLVCITIEQAQPEKLSCILCILSLLHLKQAVHVEWAMKKYNADFSALFIQSDLP